MTHFRKKPIEIEAMLFERSTAQEVAMWCGGRVRHETKPSDHSDVATWLEFPTLEGIMRAHLGDYVIRGVKGEFYVCRPDIFVESYEEVVK